jgi:DNA excision repair protein ERCC-4
MSRSCTSLSYLLTYDSIAFNTHLESILTSSASTTGSSGASGQGPRNRPDQSPWLYLDAANTLFHVAKRRAYLPPPSKSKKSAMQQANADAQAAVDGSEDDLEALREVEMADARASASGSSRWPPGVEPVLEELPKWGLLAGVLEEIEEEIESLDRQGIEGMSATVRPKSVLLCLS